MPVLATDGAFLGSHSGPPAWSAVILRVQAKEVPYHPLAALHHGLVGQVCSART